jgi:hypothetical protein
MNIVLLPLLLLLMLPLLLLTPNPFTMMPGTLHNLPNQPQLITQRPVQKGLGNFQKLYYPPRQLLIILKHMQMQQPLTNPLPLRLNYRITRKAINRYLLHPPAVVHQHKQRRANPMLRNTHFAESRKQLSANRIVQIVKLVERYPRSRRHHSLHYLQQKLRRQTLAAYYLPRVSPHSRTSLLNEALLALTLPSSNHQRQTQLAGSVTLIQKASRSIGWNFNGGWRPVLTPIGKFTIKMANNKVLVIVYIRICS